MCSNGGSRQVSAGDIAAEVARTVDELAAAVSAGDDAAGERIAAQLAGAWAMITAADPELAGRMARYSPS
jgi:hypothetical protein